MSVMNGSKLGKARGQYPLASGGCGQAMPDWTTESTSKYKNTGLGANLVGKLWDSPARSLLPLENLRAGTGIRPAGQVCNTHVLHVNWVWKRARLG